MASGQSLVRLLPTDNEPPATNFAQRDDRNGSPLLNFDATTQWTAIFSDVMPLNYGAGGITIVLYCTLASATTGTLGWDVAFERRNTDVDADSFATAQVVAAVTVPANNGDPLVMSLAIAHANLDGVVAGDWFRVRVRRDTADTAAGFGQIGAIHISET